MSAQTIPLTAQPAKKTHWTPSDRDRLIFQWIKFDGHTQDWVAQQLEISQSTVSRIVERYQRWIARGGPGLNGGLSHDEQIRYQRWLTYERNERILASCMRIATDMERQLDVSRTTITRNNLSPSQESEVKTYHETLDRSGAAARYLRLAYRINMDQLKLIEQTPLPPLAPLTEEEIAADDQASGSRQPPATPTHSEPSTHGNTPASNPSAPSGPPPAHPSSVLLARAPAVHNPDERIPYLTPDRQTTSTQPALPTESLSPACRESCLPPKSQTTGPFQQPPPTPFESGLPLPLLALAGGSLSIEN